MSWLDDTTLGQVSDPATRQALAGMDFSHAANAGVNGNPLFQQLIAGGATPQQLQNFATMITDPSKDWAGQFGKYADAGLIQKNIADFLGGGTQQGQFGAAAAGHGGWLQHNIGDIARGVINPLDAATGGRLGKEMGRIGGDIYDKTAGQLGGWLGDHVFGQHGALAGITRGLNSYSVGALTPGSLAPLESAGATDYWQNREHGASARQAIGAAGSDAATIAATALTFGGAAGLSPLASAGAHAAVGAAGAGANAYGSGQNVLTAALKGGAGGALSGVVGAALPGGGVAGAAGRGAISGAIAPAIAGGNSQNIWEGGVLGGIAGGIGAGTTATTGNSALGGLTAQLSRLGVSSLLPSGSTSSPAGATINTGNAGANMATPTTPGASPDIATLLSQLIPALGLGYAANQAQKQAGTAQNIADPWGPNRGQYATDLNNLMANPAQAIKDDPGYQFTLDQGVNALDRRNNAMGMLNSGNAQYDITNYAQGLATQTFNADEQRLAQLAGVTSSSPSAAGQLYQTGNTQANAALGGGVSAAGGVLNSLIGLLKGSGGGSSGGLAQILSGLFGSGGSGGTTNLDAGGVSTTPGGYGGRDSVASPGGYYDNGSLSLGGAPNPWDDGSLQLNDPYSTWNFDPNSTLDSSFGGSP